MNHLRLPSFESDRRVEDDRLGEEPSARSLAPQLVAGAAISQQQQGYALLQDPGGITSCAEYRMYGSAGVVCVGVVSLIGGIFAKSTIFMVAGVVCVAVGAAGLWYVWDQ